MKIQRPTIGRIVIFTAWRGVGDAGKADECAGVIVKVHGSTLDAESGCVDLVTFDSSGIYHNNDVDHDVDGVAGTWRYPPRCTDEIEVES